MDYSEMDIESVEPDDEKHDILSSYSEIREFEAFLMKA